MTNKPEFASTTPNGTFAGRHSSKDQSAYSLATEAFTLASIPLIDKLEAFPRFSTKRSLARFLVKHEMFKMIVDTTGVVVECGVFNGAGLFTWAQLSNIYEPTNYTRKIIGFDTFSGFPAVNENVDNAGVLASRPGDLRGSSLDELLLSVEKNSHERHLSHIQNIELVQGDFMKTADAYLAAQPQTIVSLLYLDFDLYEPTKKALEVFLPRMPKGAIVAFDEINCNSFPGETKAFDEVMGIRNYRVQRFPYDPWISYIQL
uniref:class I SAM-dependent methyltransferase n=1 Tax=Yoonia sp. TaxID=2212373 RepID=UPI004048BAF1